MESASINLGAARAAGHEGRKRRRVHCEHCKEFLSKSTYYRHRMRYFNAVSKQWVTIEDHNDSTSSDNDDTVSSFLTEFVPTSSEKASDTERGSSIASLLHLASYISDCYGVLMNNRLRCRSVGCSAAAALAHTV